MTVRELITAALRQIGELTPGQTPNAEETASGLELLNNILENWELARRKVFIIDNLQFQLTSGQNVYTMGIGAADFNSYRPVKIQAANVIFTDTQDPKDGVGHALELVSSQQFANIREKSLPAQRPLKLYNDNDFPILKLYLWPTPTLPTDGLGGGGGGGGGGAPLSLATLTDPQLSGADNPAIGTMTN